MGKTPKLLATACSAAVLALAQAAFAADTAPRASQAKPEAGLDTASSCDQMTGKEREQCLQNLPGRKGSAARGSTSSMARDRDAAHDNASTGSSIRGRDNTSGSATGGAAGVGANRSGEVRGPNANSGLNTGTSCDEMTGEERQKCLQNLPPSQGTLRRR